MSVSSTPRSDKGSTISASSSASSRSGASFSRLIESSLARRFPRRFANSGDISGVTIGSLRDVERGGTAVVVLCVDLTEQVLAEAVAMHADHLVCYAPMPRVPMAMLSTDDPQGRIVLKCAQEAMAVHSLHTACANAPHGVADWLAESLASGTTSPILPHVEVAQAGEGRLLECSRATPLSALISRLKELLGVRHLRLALGAVVDETSLAKAIECCYVKTIALHVGDRCASVLNGSGANVYVASEMAHSEVLAANAHGVIVLLAGHSTIERAFLRHLRQELEDEFGDSDWNVKVKLSQVDSSPLAIV